MSIKVQCEVRVYEIDGKEVPYVDNQGIRVCSHWNWQQFVVIVLPDGKSLTVSHSDLSAAINNSKNSNK